MYITLKWENVENVAVDLFSTLSNTWVLIKGLTDRQSNMFPQSKRKDCSRGQRAVLPSLYWYGKISFLFTIQREAI